MIGGLVWWKSKQSTPQPVATPKPPPTAEEMPVNAPPPPPKIDDTPDAGGDDGGGKVAVGGPAKGSCGGKCGDGKSSAALNSALRGTAGSAQGCYNRALRNSEVSGSLTVSVQVGSNGNVCGASIANDSVGSSEVSQCVLNRFRGKQFPAPESGCVVVSIPINFTIKQ